MKRLLLLCLTTLLLIFSDSSKTIPTFTPQDFLLPNDFTYQPKTELTQQHFIYDIEFLIHAMENAYSGFLYFPENEILKIKKDLRKIPNDLAKSKKDFCETLAHTLAQIPDKHLQVHNQEKKCGYDFYSLKEDDVGSNLGANQSENQNWSYHEIPHQGLKIPVIAITEFRAMKREKWAPYFETLEQSFTSPFLIFDLRGNLGGEIEPNIETIYYLHGNRQIPLQATVKKWLTPEAWALEHNRLLLEKKSFERDQKPEPEYLEETLKYTRQGYQWGLDNPQQRFASYPINSKTRFPEKKYPGYHGQIFVLADSKCASSCEYMVKFLQSLPNTTVIGQLTAGIIHFGSPGKLVLPHSQLTIDLPTFTTTFDDNTFHERMGVAPDVYLPSGNDALEEALKRISETLQKPSTKP